MLNEPAASRSNHIQAHVPKPPPTREELLHNQVRERVSSVMAIETEVFLPADHESDARPADDCDHGQPACGDL